MLRVALRSVSLPGAALSPLTVVRRACTEQCKLLQLATGQSLQFTGMGGPMGVYENYDTNICNDGGTFCVQRDNEGFYGRPMDEASALAGIGDGKCPPAFDCNGVAPQYWHPNNYV